MAAGRMCWNDVEVRSADDVQRSVDAAATWLTGMQQFDKYTGALPSRHWWVSTPSLYFTRSGMSWCISRDSPWSNFLMSLMTRAAAFNTRCCLRSRGEDCIAIIDTRRHEGMNECRRRISVKRPPDASELTKMIKAGRADTGKEANYC